MLRFDDVAQEDLVERLRNQQVDWDTIVKVASAHLMLPAVYCRLEQKSLLSYLPEELVQYLEALTELNRARNRTLKQEAQTISRLFKIHHIEHVFIKGIALLVGNHYTDLGERMIGDIDILIASDDLDKAFDLLVVEGYSKVVTFNYEVKDYRHRPRQLSETRLGAVELHDELLKHGYNNLLDKITFLKSKEVVNAVTIPNPKMLIWNTILAHQINDHHSYFGTINLKGIYDVLVLKLNKKPNLIIELLEEKHCLQFLSLAAIFIPSIVPSEKKLVIENFQQIFLLKSRFPFFGKLIFKFKLLYLSVSERLVLLTLNKSYRAHLIKNKLFK